MKKMIYYLTKSIVTLPCLGLLPLFGILAWQSFALSASFRAVVVIILMIGYIGMVFEYFSPSVNRAYLESAESPKKFFWVNFVITMLFTVFLAVFGIFLWALMHQISAWFEGIPFEHQLFDDSSGFVGTYICLCVYFHIAYLLLWECVRKRRLIHQLTKPNVCW